MAKKGAQEMTKEQFKKELIEFKKRVEDFENVRKELETENSEVAEILNEGMIVPAIVAAKMISIISRFFGIDSRAIKINK
jgi:hypothetical protein